MELNTGWIQLVILVNMKKSAKNGDIVVALVDGANTLKRFTSKNGQVYLKAENDEYADIHPDNELVIQGVVSSLIRQYN